MKNIMRWIPVEMEETEVRNIIGNTMIHLFTPQSPKALLVQHAVAREALRLGLEHHKTLASRLKGVKVERDISQLFDQALEETYVDMMKVNLIVGKGRVLSDAPKMEQVALILLDALQPGGIWEVMIDKATILPHLGMLLRVNREAALEILTRDCLLRLGTCIAPKGVAKEGDEVMRIRMKRTDGTEVEEMMTFGDLTVLPLEMGGFAEVEILPARGFDVGNGRGKRLRTRIIGGAMGLIIDARGRPIFLSGTKQKIGEWTKTLDAYPSTFGGQGSGGD